MPARKVYRKKRPSDMPRYPKPARRKHHYNVYDRLSMGLGKKYLHSKRAGLYAGQVLKGGAELAARSFGRHLVGRGDYRLEPGGDPIYGSQALMNLGSVVPSFGSGNQNTRVCHREFLGDVNSSVAFTNTSFPINPGMFASFPWLSALAANYEEYKIIGMVFQFKSTSASALNSTNTALGTVIMATQYNAALDDFINKLEMENYQYTTSCKPSQDMMHPIECSAKVNPLSKLYIRTGDIDANSDIRMYDLGNFQLATVGSQAAAVIGELWVTYCVELIKPRLASGQFGQTVLSSHYVIPVAGIDSTHFFGSSLPSSDSYESGSNILITFGNTTITFPSTLVTGVYLVEFYYSGASTALTTDFSWGATSNCSNVNIFANSAASTRQQVAGVTSTMQYCIRCIKLTGPNAVMTNANATTVPGTLTSCDVVITQLNSNISS